MMGSMTARRSPGRPRSDEADRAILDAAFRLLKDRGYDSMTIEGVAAAAGVAKTTVYRRYTHKADLASAALASHTLMPRTPSSGSVRERLIELVNLFGRGVIGSLGTTVLGTLMVQEEHHPQLMTLFRARVMEPRRRMIATVLREGMTAGELRPDLDVDGTVDLLVGGVLMHRIAKGKVPAGYGARVVDALWPAITAQTA